MAQAYAIRPALSSVFQRIDPFLPRSVPERGQNRCYLYRPGGRNHSLQSEKSLQTEKSLRSATPPALICGTFNVERDGF